MRLTLRASGGARPELAWERYADLDAWRGWSPQISRVETDGPRRLEAGLRGTVLGAPLRGRPMLRVTFTVAAVDDGARWWGWTVAPTRVVADLPPALRRLATLRLEHGVEPSPSGASTTLVVHGRAVVALGYALPALIALRSLVRAPGTGRGSRRPRPPRR